MSFEFTILLALIQGITEFLPISSSGHLVLLWEVTEQGEAGAFSVSDGMDQVFNQRAIDVAAHVGTLLAVLLFFRADIARLFGGFLGTFRTERGEQTRLFWLLVLASLPLIAAGLFLSDLVDLIRENPVVVALASIGFGLVIWFFDATRPNLRTTEVQLDTRGALVFGFFQALALIPGTSRSGITMAAGRALGFDRASGTKIALLLSIPAISASAAYETLRLVTADVGMIAPGLWTQAGTVAVLCAVTAYVTLAVFTRFLPHTGFLPYVLYRVGLGLVILAAVALGWF